MFNVIIPITILYFVFVGYNKIQNIIQMLFSNFFFLDLCAMVSYVSGYQDSTVLHYIIHPKYRVPIIHIRS